MRTFMRWMPDPPTEVDRGNGVTQFLYPPIEDTGEIIKTFPINESKRIIQFPERKPARKKTLGWIFLTAIMAMYVFGLVFLKELLFWHDGILYKPYWIATYLITFLDMYANFRDNTKKKNRPSGNQNDSELVTDRAIK